VALWQIGKYLQGHKPTDFGSLGCQHICRTTVLSLVKKCQLNLLADRLL